MKVVSGIKVNNLLNTELFNKRLKDYKTTELILNTLLNKELDELEGFRNYLDDIIIHSDKIKPHPIMNELRELDIYLTDDEYIVALELCNSLIRDTLDHGTES